jgi:alpha-tubulin suppressor-like RCC1 family protein
VAVRSVALGREHIVAVGTDGRVFSAGAGANGQLGHGSFDDHHGAGLRSHGR